MESIPRNELGKVAKAALRERYRDLFAAAENAQENTKWTYNLKARRPS